jgi:NTP pyrophosphatase (non-canonical NTP hydrolase)
MSSKVYDLIPTTLANNIDALARDINAWAKGKGFWDVPVELMRLADSEPKAFAYLERLIKSQKMALVTTETSEQVEAIRKPDSETGIPGFTNEEEECADQVIRLLDYAGQYKFRLGEALIAKMAVNEGRPYKHGKEF